MFAAEDVGWQVSVEGSMPPEVAVQFVAAVTGQGEREVRGPVEWIQITW